MSEHDKKEEKNQIRNLQNERVLNDTENSLRNINLNKDMEYQMEKEDINFEDIDFNINPFNNDNSKDDEKSSESNELVLEEKEEEKSKLNNIPLNPKFHTSNELVKIDFFQDNISKEIKFDKNNLNNIDNNNNNISSNKNGNNNQLIDINNNSDNLKLDLKANSFIPKNSNNNYNNNNFSAKERTSWVCSFCHNFNYNSKKYIYFII